MAGLDVLKFPEPRLRKKAKKVVRIDAVEQKTLSDMAQTMYLNKGVGLAATQVGIDKQLAVIDVGGGLVKMVNPQIVKREGLETEEEGCLSVPEVTVKVKRAKKVTVNFLNESGLASQIKAEGLLARAIQHELDHLSGRLIIDYMNPLRKLLLKQKKSYSKKI